MAWWETRERYEGWKETLTRAGLTPLSSLVAQGDWSAASGEQGMQRLLTQQPDIDAVFACNDQMALGALGVAHTTGRQVPQDIALVGFDNTPESAHFWPSLTTVNQHLVEVGRTAVQVLHKLIEARRGEENIEPTTAMLATDLVIRRSSLPTLAPSFRVAAVQSSDPNPLLKMTAR
jgi:LacI family transcriptional regulator